MSTASASTPQLSDTGDLGNSPLVVFNWNPASQLPNFLAATAAVAAGTAGARAKIIAIGDSTTAGFGGAASGYRGTVSYPAQLAQYLSQDGLAAQSDNFLGGGQNVDGRIALVGGAIWSGAYGAGGQAIELQSVGDGVDFTPTTPGSYDRVDINYLDVGSGGATVSVNGGPVLATLSFGNTGVTKTQTVDLPAGTDAVLNIRATTGNITFIEGVGLWSSTTPAVEVYNAGEGGATSGGALNVAYGNGTTTGIGEIPGALEIAPQLVLIDYGINDILNGTTTAAQTAANITLMVTEFRAANCDPIIVIPTPFENAAYATALPALRAALQSLSTTLNVPLIDLSATYGDNWTALYNAGLMSDYAHPDATLYGDIGAQIAALLAHGSAPVVSPAALPTVSSGTSTVLATVSPGSGNDPLTVSLISDAALGSGGTLSLNSGSIVYTPGSVTADNQEAQSISYAVTDTVTGVTTGESQAVQLAPACFAPGSRIRTTRGAVAVEDIRPGDRVCTFSGRARPVIWIGSRHIDIRHHDQPRDVLPVRVMAGAFAPDVPAHDLVLSPEHAVFAGGALIPVKRLINGSTIAQQACAQITYFHIEVEPHDVLFAEGLPVESYFDTGSRAIFTHSMASGTMASGDAPAGSITVPGAGRGAITVATRCAPVMEAGAVVDSLRARLARRAAALGRRAPAAKTLRIAAPGAINVHLDGDIRFLRLASRAGCAGTDRRHLGALISRIIIDGETVALDDARLGVGFHPVEQHGPHSVRWTDGDAVIDFGPAGGGRSVGFMVHALAGGAAGTLQDERPGQA